VEAAFLAQWIVKFEGVSADKRGKVRIPMALMHFAIQGGYGVNRQIHGPYSIQNCSEFTTGSFCDFVTNRNGKGFLEKAGLVGENSRNTNDLTGLRGW
jgi:hypothetical protein